MAQACHVAHACHAMPCHAMRAIYLVAHACTKPSRPPLRRWTNLEKSSALISRGWSMVRRFEDMFHDTCLRPLPSSHGSHTVLSRALAPWSRSVGWGMVSAAPVQPIVAASVQPFPLSLIRCCRCTLQVFVAPLIVALVPWCDPQLPLIGHPPPFLDLSPPLLAFSPPFLAPSTAFP